MSAKPSPGEWFINLIPNRSYFAVKTESRVSSKGLSNVCFITPSKSIPHEEALANGRLIVAAKKLRDTLHEVYAAKLRHDVCELQGELREMESWRLKIDELLRPEGVVSQLLKSI